MESFKLILRTPEAQVFEGQVESIRFTSEGGDMQVFAHHASLTATILFSPIVLQTDSSTKETYMVRRGLFLFDNASNMARLLALSCEAQSEISEQSIKEYLELLDQQLKNGEELSRFQLMYLEGEKLAVEEQLQG